MAINFYKAELPEEEGGDDRKILAYALFQGSKYEPSLGVATLKASADTVAELKELPEVKDSLDHDHWQIINTQTFKITDSGIDDDVIICDGVYV